MKELKRHLPPSAQGEGPNDVYSQVLAKIIKGCQVRMYGYGTTTKEVYIGDSLRGEDIHQVTMENERLQREIKEKNKLIERLLGSKDLRGHSYIPNVLSTSNNFAPTQSTRPSNVNSHPLQVQVHDAIDAEWI